MGGAFMGKKFKVVITDHDLETTEMEKSVLNGIATVESYQCETEEEVITVARDADAIITDYAPISEKVAAHLKQCKIVSSYNIGIDNINLKALNDKGIIVSHVPDYCLHEVAEYTIGLMFMLVRRMLDYNQIVKDKEWKVMFDKPIYRMKGLTVGFVGFGKIAQTICQRMASFGFDFLAYDKYIQKFEQKDFSVNFTSLDEVFAKSDIVSVHLPLTTETHRMIGREYFSKMKPHAYFINTARGRIVDTDALYETLKEGRIAGAGLDVFDPEPPNWNHKILTLDNVIITPHVAFYSEDSVKEMTRSAAENVRLALTGQTPHHIVKS